MIGYVAHVNNLYVMAFLGSDIDLLIELWVELIVLIVEVSIGGVILLGLCLTWVGLDVVTPTMIGCIW